VINFCRTSGLALLVAIAAPAAAQERQLTVTLLGTGCPPAVMNRFGPSTLVEAGDQKFVFDAGRGAMQRLTELKVRWQGRPRECSSHTCTLTTWSAFPIFG
jgi:ribonuclease Z